MFVRGFQEFCNFIYDPISSVNVNNRSFHVLGMFSMNLLIIVRSQMFYVLQSVVTFRTIIVVCRVVSGFPAQSCERGLNSEYRMVILSQQTP